MPPLTGSITRYVERPEPTPADQFEAYLAEHPPTRPRGLPPPRLPWRERIIQNARALLILGLAWGVVALVVAWRAGG